MKEKLLQFSFVIKFDAMLHFDCTYMYFVLSDLNRVKKN